MTPQSVADETGKQKLPCELVGQLFVKFEELVRRIREGTIPPQRALNDLQRLIEGETFVGKPYIIDCDVNPLCTKGFRVEDHKKGGAFKWDAAKVKLYLSTSQQDGKCVEGDKLRKELESQPTLNANVLDFLLAHPELIPDEWRGKTVFFWGTIYRHSGGRLYVRYLCWGGICWIWNYYWLGGQFSDDYLAAVIA